MQGDVSPPGASAVRLLRDTDSISELTALLHRAYAPLAARGLRFVATHQNDDTTRARCSKGECLVAEQDGRVVATLTWYPSDTWRRALGHSECAWYERPDVARFGQFAVEPSLQRRGLGRALLHTAERRAAAAAHAELACDTAAPATHLIEMYQRWGFRLVDRVRWSSVNYESVVLSKTL